MSRVAIVAYGAVSALGRGAQAVSAGACGEPARVAIARDAELEQADLRRPFAARVDLGVAPDVRAPLDRAAALLGCALADCARELDRIMPSWRRMRVGLVLGTSSGGMRAAEPVFAALARNDAPPVEPHGATYYGPMATASRALGLVFAPAALVLAACASSAVAIGLASRWLERGACDLALAGGFDDVTVFVASGFEALRATTACPPPRPFREGRDGMSLGEGAGVVALALSAAKTRGYVSGFGLSCDAVHLTAPDREAGGLIRAADAALRDAGRPRIDLVGAHGTATPFNDSAELRAIARVLGGGSGPPVVVHPLKAQIGHTLGAAGVLESLACADAIERGILPAAAGEGALEPGATVRLLDRAAPGAPRSALKLAAAFGGASAALVIAADPSPRAPAFRPAFVHAACAVEGEPSLDEVARLARMPVERVARGDGLVRLVLAAVGALEEKVGSLAGSGLVVGSALATMETNALFAARIRALGARSAEPRRFPYTSPNAAPGEASIAFRLTGPSLCVGGGFHAALEAFAVAALLVEAGDADRMIVVGADEGGPMSEALFGGALGAGAVAVLLSSQAGGARARVERVTLRRGVSWAGRPIPGHRALGPLTAAHLPSTLESASPPDAHAEATLVPL